MEANQHKDECKCGANQNVMAQLDTAKGERVVFSCIVTKYNRWNMKQERILLLTNQTLYNIKKDQVQRRIAVSSIKAVTKSLNKDNKEFVIHVKAEYDYRFDSDKIASIFNALKDVFFQTNKVNLPVYGVPDRLKEYHTSKKDIANGIEVNPQEEYRLHKEDIYDPNGLEANHSSSSSVSGSMPSHQPQSQINSTTSSQSSQDGFDNVM